MEKLVLDMVAFFRKARHLWGRCPHCGEPFRLSDAAISSNPEPPRDWLRRIERRTTELKQRESELDELQDDLAGQAEELTEQERDLAARERAMERNARRRVQEILKSKTELQAAFRAERQDAVRRSRSTLLGKMFESLSPFLQRLSLDPRDMRPIFNPIDYVCFDGLTAERRIKQLTFIEVKCGVSRTSAVQKGVRDAIEKQRVEFQVWEVGNPKLPIAEQLSHRRRLLLPNGDFRP